MLAGQVVRGRIDAVYAEPATAGRLPGRRLEDQPRRRPPTRSSSRSTGSPGPSSPACPLERVRAAFYYVRTGDVVEPADLPGRAELERLLELDRLGRCRASRPQPSAAVERDLDHVAEGLLALLRRWSPRR